MLGRLAPLLLLAWVAAGCGAKDGMQKPGFPPAPPTHQVVVRAAWYLAMPSAGDPADGTFPVGTKVHVWKSPGRFSLVQTEDGKVVWTATAALGPLSGNGAEPAPDAPH